MAIASVVYTLCALTSLTCCVLLLRSFRARHARLLLWSGVCFAGLALNNFLLVVDLLIVPSVDLSVWRGLLSVGSLVILLYGLVWDAR